QGDSIASLADLRDEGFPGRAVHAYLEELGLPRHDVRLDLKRLRRLAIDVIETMSDEELAAAAAAPVAAVPALPGARTLREPREIARQVLRPAHVELDEAAAPTIARFLELREAAPEMLDDAGARSILRELKAVGGDLHALRLAITGADRGPELAAVLAVLPR